MPSSVNSGVYVLPACEALLVTRCEVDSGLPYFLSIRLISASDLAVAAAIASSAATAALPSAIASFLAAMASGEGLGMIPEKSE